MYKISSVRMEAGRETREEKEAPEEMEIIFDSLSAAPPRVMKSSWIYENITVDADWREKGGWGVETLFRGQDVMSF